MKAPEDITKEQLIRDLTDLRSRITELERSEEDRRKRHDELIRVTAMYEGLFEFSPDAIIVVGRDGEIVRVNKQAEKLFGYSRNELLNLSHEILLPKRLREIHGEHRRKFMSEPRRIRPMGTGLELYGKGKDGSEFSVDIALGPLKAGDDIVIVAVIRDVSERVRDATERKRAEEGLRESENRYRTLFNALDEGFCIVEVIFDDNKNPVDYRFLEINPSFEKQTGLIAAQGKRMRELAPKHEKHWFEIYGKIALTGEPVRFQNRADQLHRWYDVYAFRIGKPEDRQVAVLFNDITGRKESEDTLKLTRFSVDHASVSAFLISKDAHILYVNEQTCRSLGYSREELLVMTIPDLDPKVTMSAWNGIWEKLKKEGSWRAESLHRKKDGTVIPVEISANYVSFGGKEYDWVYSTDISERKRTENEIRTTIDGMEKAEEALLKSEERLKRAQEIAHLGSWELDLRNDHLTWSDEVYRIFGLQPQEFKATYEAFLEAVHPDDRAAVDAAYSGSLRDGRDSYEIEHRVVRKANSEVRVVHEKCDHIRDESGKVVRSIGMVHDITERKRAEEALKRAADTGERLRDVMVGISSSRTFDDALKQLLNAALELAGMEGGGVYVVEKGLAVLRFQKCLPAAFIHKVAHMPMERPIIKAVLKQKDLVDLVEEFGDMLEPFDIHHAFSIPLRVRDEPFGFLNVGSTRLETPAQVDIQTLNILATGTESLLHRLLIENELRESEAQLSAILHNTPAAVYMLGTDGRLIHVNRRFEEVFGITSVRSTGMSLQDLFPRETAALLLSNNQKVIESRTALEFEEVIPQSDGLHVYASVKSPLLDASGQAYAIVGISTDISERKKMEEEIRHLAHHDALTGLPNRRLFRDITLLELAQARRNRRKLAILFLDLDRFKEINDTLGHEAGDDLLKQAAGLFRETIRASDTVARIGGDEFNIILADIGRPEDVSDIAHKIIRRFRSPFLVSGNELNVTTSIGISVYPDDSTEIDTLLRYADIAMYHAKESGRNTFRFYNPAINIRSLERMQLGNMLRRSIEMEELVVYYQPQIDIQNKRMVCAEALVRWRHPEQGFLTPDRFLAQAEETGFITEIDEWALKTACAQVRSWIESGLPHVCITVNLSARQFEKPDLVERIASILKETRMEPGHLNLEVTETTAMSDVDRTASQLRQLREMGAHVSIDDFGTGYSSLNYLKKLPIERLKIDKSFIRDIAHDPDDRAIISAVTSMAHKMGIRTVAEGVETEEQLAFLRSIECDEVQGFLFSRPLPAEKFKELVSLR